MVTLIAFVMNLELAKELLLFHSVHLSVEKNRGKRLNVVLNNIQCDPGSSRVGSSAQGMMGQTGSRCMKALAADKMALSDHEHRCPVPCDQIVKLPGVTHHDPANSAVTTLADGVMTTIQHERRF